MIGVLHNEQKSHDPLTWMSRSEMIVADGEVRVPISTSPPFLISHDPVRTPSLVRWSLGTNCSNLLGTNNGLCSPGHQDRKSISCNSRLLQISGHSRKKPLKTRFSCFLSPLFFGRATPRVNDGSWSEFIHLFKCACHDCLLLTVWISCDCCCSWLVDVREKQFRTKFINTSRAPLKGQTPNWTKLECD